MALVTTPGGTDSDAYVSVADADTYFTNRLHSDVWTAADNTTKEAAIRWATRLLDQQLEWHGHVRTREQALRWPRIGVYSLDDIQLDESVIPTFLEQATAELAILLISKDRTVEPDTQGFSSISVGPISLTVDKHDRLVAIPESVFSICQPYARRLSSTTKLRRA